MGLCSTLMWVLGCDPGAQGEMLAVSAPSSCLPSYARNDLESIPGYLSDLAEQVRPGGQPVNIDDVSGREV